MKIKTRPEKPTKLALTPETALLIKEAYQLFQQPVSKRLNVCSPCCISEERMRELTTTPVAELSVSAIYDYLDAVHYDETGYEIKPFLPRILELLANGEEIRLSTEITLDKCHFERNSWTEKELDFMQRYTSEFIKNVLSTPQSYAMDNAMSYILMFDLAGLPTEYLLKVWEESLSETPEALEHLVSLFRWDIKDFQYSNSFSENPNFNNQITQWIKSPALAQKVLPIIEKFYFNSSTLNDEDRYWLDWVYAQFSSIQIFSKTKV